MKEQATVGDVIVIAIIVVVIFAIIKGCADDYDPDASCKCRYDPRYDEVFCTRDDGSLCDD